MSHKYARLDSLDKMGTIDPIACVGATTPHLNIVGGQGLLQAKGYLLGAEPTSGYWSSSLVSELARLLLHRVYRAPATILYPSFKLAMYTYD